MSTTTTYENPESRLPVDTLANSVLLLLVLSVAQRLVGLIRASLFCRWLSPEELGRWDMLFAFLMTAGPLVVLALSSCLGRYVEPYRQRRALRTFIRRTATVYGVLAGAGAGAVFLLDRPLSMLVFGSVEQSGLIRLAAAALLAVAAFNYLYELCTALRNTRLIVMVQMGNSLLFAGIGLALLWSWQLSATSVLIAYAAACTLTVLGATAWLVRRWDQLPEDRECVEPAAAGRFWRPLLLYSMWAWMAATMSNLFEVADRYMIVHFSPGDSEQALALVGDYHTSRLLPVLMVSLAALVGSIVTPHLSHDWERGARDEVVQRLNLLVKLFGTLLLLAALAVLLVAPFLFGWVLQGKYSGGLAVLPMTLAYCLWFSLFLILENYVLCCERSHLVSLAMGLGLGANIGLNLILLPRFGLPGAVAATTTANAAALMTLLWFSQRRGLRLHRGTMVVLALPASLMLGTWAAAVGVFLLLLFTWRTDWVLDRREKATVAEYIRGLAERLPGGQAAVSPASRQQPGHALMWLQRQPAALLYSLADGLKKQAQPPSPRPLRVMFVITCMPVGGAETLLVQLVSRLDRQRFAPEVCCLKYRGPLGEVLAAEVPVHSGLLAHKYDLRVLPRLAILLRRRRIDAVVTVGTGGDKMFWGRLAGRLAGVPVICSALHSTGLPDRVEWLNRQLAFLTDAFIAVARLHGLYLAEHEGCPPEKVRVIPNGVDTGRFAPGEPRAGLCEELGIMPDTPVVTIVAALRPEKNHTLFLKTAARVQAALPRARFVVVGDGPCRSELEALAERLGLAEQVMFLGTRYDVPDIWRLTSVGVLTSHMEANPVSLLEAMACGVPVVATRVGSVPESVIDGRTGLLAEPGDAGALAERIIRLLDDPAVAEIMGRAGRAHVVADWSIDRMVAGYEGMIEGIYWRKRSAMRGPLAEQEGCRSGPIAPTPAAPVLTAVIDSPWNVETPASVSGPDQNVIM